MHTQARVAQTLPRFWPVQTSLCALQDIRVTKSYRKADPADADWLESQGKANYDHALRRWLTARGIQGTASVHVFPEPSAIDPTDE